MQISKIESHDYDAVLALNDASVPHVNLIDITELQWFVDNAACAHVARIEDRLAGFLIGLRPGLAYASPNYRWFCDNYDDFAYIDRVVVSPWARRQGVADSLYETLRSSQPDAPVMTCEVNIRPSNEGSMQFHKRMGFRQVGSQEIDGGQKEVALMEKTI
jgi:predicted GNAT superfamily acetyltransferase